MKKLMNGVVLSNELFSEYMKFASGATDYSKDIIKKIMAFHFDGFVTNVKQYIDAGVALPNDVEIVLRKSERVNQSLGDLARNYTVYKIILTNDPDKKNYPFINIDDPECRISVSVTGSFKIQESRQKAIDHIKSLCAGAKTLYIYDKYLNSNGAGVQSRLQSALDQIIPTTKVTVNYNILDKKTLQHLQSQCPDRNFLQKPFKDHHDRYIIVDKKIEIIISSGFDHLTYEHDKELTYIVRNIQGKTSTLLLT